MDTRLKRFDKFNIARIMVFILVIVLFTGFISSVVRVIMDVEGNLNVIFERDYLSSDSFINESQNILYELNELLTVYRNEEYIDGLSFEGNHDFIRRNDEIYNSYINAGGYDDDLTYEENLEMYKIEKKDEIEKLKDSLRKERKRQMTLSLKSLLDEKGVYFYASNGEDRFTNLEDVEREGFKKYPIYMLIDDEDGVEYEPESMSFYFSYDYDEVDEYTVYLGLDESFIQPRERVWQGQKDKVMESVKPIPILGISLFAAFILLAILAGRSDVGEDRIKMTTIDRLYTDINVVLCGITIFTWFGIIAVRYDRDGQMLFQNGFKNLSGLSTMFLSVTAILGTIGLALVMSLIRHIKNRSLFKHSLIYTIFRKIFDFLKGIYNTSGTGKKIVFLLIIYPIALGISFFIFPITIALFIWLALRKVEEYEAVKEGVGKIRDGDLDYKIEIEKDGEFKDLAESINDIGAGLSNAVDNELKSERHKAELITNVSHDIRTPLTSIITYVDLLKQEEDEDKRKEYIGVIDQKSDRLKKLIDDLFEASKVTSGNIPVNLTRIDIVSLLNQGLGEMNEEIEEKELNFITNFDREEMDVRADGDLLWRALENLLSNILKYALDGSRVYVDIEENDEYNILTMKNISAYELNITEDELMERFKRGDESRTSEGSGLGLSIAESLVELQDGKFEIEIDGDLFKTIMKLPKYE